MIDSDEIAKALKLVAITVGMVCLAAGGGLVYLLMTYFGANP